MTRALGKEHEADHVGAGVERGVEGGLRGKAADFDNGRHGALLSVKALVLSKGSECPAQGLGGSLSSGLVFRLARAEVAFKLVDFVLRRGPHLGFRFAVKGHDPSPLAGQRGAAALDAAMMR